MDTALPYPWYRIGYALHRIRYSEIRSYPSRHVFTRATSVFIPDFQNILSIE